MPENKAQKIGKRAPLLPRHRFLVLGRIAERWPPWGDDAAVAGVMEPKTRVTGNDAFGIVGGT